MNTEMLGWTENVEGALSVSGKDITEDLFKEVTIKWTQVRDKPHGQRCEKKPDMCVSHRGAQCDGQPSLAL